MKIKTIKLAVQILKKIDVAFLHNEVNDFYDLHPFPNSFSFFSDLLKEKGIDNTVIQFTNENYLQFFSLSLPVLTFSNTNDGEFLIIENITDKHIAYYSAYGGRANTLISTFIEKWQGVVLVPFREEEMPGISWNMKLYDLLFMSSKVVPYILPIILLLYLFVNNNLTTNVILATSVAGVIVSILIFLYYNKTTNFFIEKVCGEGDACGDILDSSASLVFGKLKWVDMSVAYFTSLTIGILLFFKKESDFAALFSFLSPLTIFFSIYSLYYQLAIQKKICKFCILIVSIFVLQNTIFLFYVDLIDRHFILSHFLIFSILFLFSLLSWLYIENVLKNILRFKNDSSHLKSFKFNKNVFNTLCLIEPNKLTDLVLDKSFYLGKDLSATNKIVAFISLECKACKDIILELNNWLDNPYENFSFHLILSAGKEKASQRYILSKYFIEKCLRVGPKAAIEWILNWYNNPYPLIYRDFDPEIEAVIESHSDYISRLKLNHTPVVFYNERKLPSGYLLNDIKFVIDV